LAALIVVELDGIGLSSGDRNKMGWGEGSGRRRPKQAVKGVFSSALDGRKEGWLTIDIVVVVHDLAVIVVVVSIHGFVVLIPHALSTLLLIYPRVILERLTSTQGQVK
jgi:hypothetical protein